MTESRKSSPIIGDGGVSRFPLWREPDCVNGVDQGLVSTRHDTGASIHHRQLVSGFHRLGDFCLAFLGALDGFYVNPLFISSLLFVVIVLFFIFISLCFSFLYFFILFFFFYF